MSLKDRMQEEIEDPVLEQALVCFKASVDAWSDAAMNRPRALVKTARHIWRLAAASALGCVVAVSCITGALVERHHRQDAARIAVENMPAQPPLQQQTAVKKPVVAGPHAAVGATGTIVETASTQDRDLLAAVDNAVSRQIPAAMEPLAQLMDGDLARENTAQ
jgi:hypothetical protein